MLALLHNRVGLISSIFRYQWGSFTSDKTMSEDSKNTFGSSVGVIQTRCKPLKVAASTVYYSIEAEKFLASKIAEMNFLLYKMMLLIPILKKLSFYLQKQKNFYSNPNCGFGDSRVCQNYNLGYYKNFFAIEYRMIISSEMDSETSFYITKNSFQPILRSKNVWPLYCKYLWRLQLCKACNEFLWHLQMIQK